MALARLCDYLGDPQLVVKFQKLCGVEYLPDDLEIDEDTSPAAEAVTGCHNNHRVSPSNDALEQEGNLLRQRGKRDKLYDASNGQTGNGSTNNNNNEEEDKKKENGSAKMANGGSDLKNGHGLKNGFVKNGHLKPHHFDAAVNSNGTTTTTNNHNHHQTTTIRRCTEGSDDSLSQCNNQTKTCTTGGSGSATTVSSTEGPKVLIRYPALYYMAQIGAFLGNEEFYLTGFPFLIWMTDACMIRQVCMVWWLVMYLGQASKDYFGWTRPPSPPLVRLEFSHLAEFSMPSTHAMAGTAIPLVWSTLLLERYDLPTIPVLAVALMWCTTTCLSRLYLGVHTVLDLIAGIVLALGVYIVVFPLMGRVDLYQQTSTLAPITLIVASIALCTVCYPNQHKSAAKVDAITITSVLVGLGIGSWLNYQLGYSTMNLTPVRNTIPLPSLWWFVMAVLQFVVGVSVVFAVKFVVKPLTVRFFSAWYGLDHPDSKHPCVMVGYAYTTYLSLGFTISFLDPLIFTTLGFGRPGYYFDVV